MILTQDSCDMHYLVYMIFLNWPGEFYLVISCSCDYITQQLLIQDISCSLYSCHNIHTRSPCTWSIILIISVIVITFSFRYCQIYYSYYFNTLLALLLHFHILSPTVLFSLCTLAGPVLTNLYYFSVSRLGSWYRELIVEHILVQSFSGEFSFFSWLVLFRYDGWYCLCFSISYMCFYPCALVYMHIYVLLSLFITDILRYSWKRLHSSWVSVGHRQPYSVFWERCVTHSA